MIGKAWQFCQLDLDFPVFFWTGVYGQSCQAHSMYSGPGWLGYTMLRMCDGCKDVLDTDQDGSSV